jgi:hypothetical protein
MAPRVPGTPIGDLKRWRFHIRCGRCRRDAFLMPATLAETYGEDLYLAQVIRKLRCDGSWGHARCRARPSWVSLVQVSTDGKSTRKVREIVVGRDVWG